MLPKSTLCQNLYICGKTIYYNGISRAEKAASLQNPGVESQQKDGTNSILYSSSYAIKHAHTYIHLTANIIIILFEARDSPSEFCT